MCSKFDHSGLFSLELPALIAEKTIFDLLGILDSGERLLPFGRLVYENTVLSTAVQCNVVGYIDNGIVEYSSNRNYGTVLTVSCYPGYEIIGADRILCTSDGTWSDDLPTCQGINLFYAQWSLPYLQIGQFCFSFKGCIVYCICNRNSCTQTM